MTANNSFDDCRVNAGIVGFLGLFGGTSSLGGSEDTSITGAGSDVAMDLDLVASSGGIVIGALLPRRLVAGVFSDDIDGEAFAAAF